MSDLPLHHLKPAPAFHTTFIELFGPFKICGVVNKRSRGIKVAVGDQVLSIPELQTVLYEAANLVNERPIGVHSNQIDDENYLSPNDLLLGRASARVPSGPFDESCNSRKHYLFVQSIVNVFDEMGA